MALHHTCIYLQIQYQVGKVVTTLTIVLDKVSIAKQITVSNLERVARGTGYQLYHIAISECILYMNTSME